MGAITPTLLRLDPICGSKPELSSFLRIGGRKDALSELERVEESLAVFCRLMESKTRDPSTSSG
jgi:hypothetical protein